MGLSTFEIVAVVFSLVVGLLVAVIDPRTRRFLKNPLEFWEDIKFAWGIFTSAPAPYVPAVPNFENRYQRAARRAQQAREAQIRGDVAEYHRLIRHNG